MKKNVYLGTNGDMACILRSIADFDTLSEHAEEIESSDFIHGSTNWNGRDTIERTCELEGFNLTGRKISLSNPIRFYGTDYDMGHEYGWEFRVDTIYEVE